MAGIYLYQGKHTQVITADVWSIRQAYMVITVGTYSYCGKHISLSR